MKKITCLFVILFISCNTKVLNNNDLKLMKTNKNLEKELIILKNHAYCVLFMKLAKNEKLDFKDNSNYIQISNLDIKYFNDEHLKKRISEWEKKEYKSYNPENKLILMKCLDFYNSNDLKVYLDSVREVEYLNKF